LHRRPSLSDLSLFSSRCGLCHRNCVSPASRLHALCNGHARSFLSLAKSPARSRICGNRSLLHIRGIYSFARRLIRGCRRSFSLCLRIQRLLALLFGGTMP